MKKRDWIIDVIVSVMGIGISLLVGLVLNSIFDVKSLVPLIFVVGVFGVSLKTRGYIYGVVTSLISVFAVNYVFTFPYYKFDFITPQNLASAVVMLFISITTSALITKIKKQEKTKQEMEIEKMRANLLRAISHDIRTPLTTIYGSTSTIIDNFDSLSNEKKIKLLKDVREDSQWLISIVENLLSITRIEDDKEVKINKSPIVVEELVDAAILKIKKRYPNESIEVVIPNEFATVYMDGLLIEQVIINLLENSILHAKDKTFIRLIVEYGDKALFKVIDDGCGVENGKLESIFTGKSSIGNRQPADGKRKSMGIGLSVCSAILKAHGGEITYVRSNEGLSIFEFSLEMEEGDRGQ